MVSITCTVPDCEYVTDSLPAQYAMDQLRQHREDVHRNAQSRQDHISATSRPPALDRPKIDVGASIEQWNLFTRKWELYRMGSGITDTAAPAQLFQCASEQLGDSILKSDSTIMNKPLADLVTAMKSLAVVPVATGVLRSYLLQLRQDRDEPFRTFAARVTGRAESCAFKAKCPCGQNVDYTDYEIKDVLISGINDVDIRRDILGTIDIVKSETKDVVAIVEGKEMARNALQIASLSAISTFKSRNSLPLAPVQNIPSAPERNLTKNCPDCGKVYHLFSEGAHCWNKKPHRMCIECYRAKRRKPSSKASASGIHGYCESRPPQSEPPTPLAQIIAMIGALNAQPKQQVVQLDHLVFSKSEWKKAALRQHPKVQIVVTLDGNHTSKAKYRCHESMNSQALRIQHIQHLPSCSSTKYGWPTC